VVGKHLFAGCGVGDTYKTTGLVCLNLDTGEQVWRVGTDMPVWGKPVVAGNRVYYTAGTGRVTDAEAGAGRVACVQASDGSEVWSFKPDGSVLGGVVLTAQHVYFGCRGRSVYCLERSSGKLVWRQRLGGKVVSTPALARCSSSGLPVALYVVAEGEVLALAPMSGRALWQVDLEARLKAPVATLASPVVEVLRTAEGKERRRIYVAGTVTGRVGEVYCFEDELEPVPAE
jgi:outer membrane protein assembly factor BamB